MASKRRLLVTPPEEDEGDEEELNARRTDRDIAITGTWGEWFFRVFLKYLYSVAVLFVASVTPLEALRSLDGNMGLAAAFVSLLAIVPLGLWGFFRLWGDGGRWGDEPSE